MVSKSSRVLLALSLVLGVTAVQAGTTGPEFLAFYTMIMDWVTGYLGRAIAIGAFLIGALTGFVKSTVMPALIGFAFALLFTVGPSVINNMLSATI